eukprot:Tbor_TRINITY_DN5110_c0_g1::TRINITY_DN5110_c0_g1_i1::g.25985::m.25985/K01408/IDE, ide; insulysin
MTSSDLKVRVPITCDLPHTVRKLPNGVTIICVQDKTNTMPAAAVSVGVGSNNDPKDFPGLAHFCEHMLFMGTDRFPGEDAYEEAVSRNGGSTNAWTEEAATTYYFTSNVDAFPSIVEMFLDFFVSPKFNPSGVDRELHAVHSEDEKNHSSDYWRSDELLKTFCRAEHPNNAYGNGNLTTLSEEPKAKGLNIRDALVDFFGKYYVAEATCLAMYSPLDPSDLFSLAEGVLKNMKSGTPAPQTFVEKNTVLRPSAVGKWYNNITTSSQRKLSVLWMLPFGSNHYRTNPMAYYSHVLGHEDKGSIVAALRKEGLATDLNAGPGDSIDADHTTFTIDVILTDKGMKTTTKVLDIIFQKIALLKHVISEIPAENYENFKKEHVLKFEFMDISSPYDHATTLSRNAVVFKDHTCALSGDSIIYEDDIKASFSVLDYLTPQNALFYLRFGDFERDIRPLITDVKEDITTTFYGNTNIDLVTRFHHMKYSIAEVPEVLLKRWSSFTKSQDIYPSLAIPQLNPFVTDDFSVAAPGSEINPTAFDMKYGIGWVKLNEAHLQSPKNAIRVNYLSQKVIAINSPLYGLYGKLLVEISKERLSEIMYFGELVGIKSSITETPSGFIFDASGPSATTSRFLMKILSELLNSNNLCATEELYTSHSERMKRKLLSQKEEQPWTLAREVDSHASRVSPSYTWEEILNEGIPRANYDGYKAFIVDMLAAARVEVMSVGNCDIKEAKRVILDEVDTILTKAGVKTVDPSEIKKFRSFFAPPQKKELRVIKKKPYSDTNVNAMTCLTLNVASGSFADSEEQKKKTLRTILLSTCLGSIMSASFFTALRTKETLGYMVNCNNSSRSIGQESNFCFAAQSSVANPWYLYSRIHAFIDAFESQMLNGKLTQVQVDEVVNGLIKKLKSPSTSVKNDMKSLFSRRHHPYKKFESKSEEIKILEEGVTIEDLRQLYKDHLSNSAPSGRRSLLICVDSNALPDNTAGFSTVIGDNNKETIDVILPVKMKGVEDGKESKDPEEECDDDSGNEDESSGDNGLDMSDFSGETHKVSVRFYNDAVAARSDSTLYEVSV